MSERPFCSTCSNRFKILALALVVLLVTVMIGFVLAFANANPISGIVGTSEEGNGSVRVGLWGLIVSLLSGGVVGYALNWTIAHRRMLVENITQERAKWREKIRDRALEVHDAIMSKNEEAIFRLKCQFKTLLNPNDVDDQDIIRCIGVEESMSNDRLRERAEDFANLVSCLLKHDWDRAKAESAGLLGKVCRFRLWTCAVYVERGKPDCPSLNSAHEREARCNTSSP